MMKIFLTTLTISILSLQICIDNQADTIEKVDRQLYARTQYAGNLGLVSFGVGSGFFNNKVTLDLNYGYLPKVINDVWIHTFALKPAFNFKEFNILSGISAGCYIGTTVTYSVGRNIYTKLPDFYPLDYYLPNSMHLNPFLGVRTSFIFNHRKTNKLSFYAEMGTVEYKIWYAIKNKNIKLDEIWNLCFGLIFQLKK